MKKPNYPKVSATVIDEDTVRIGGSFFSRVKSCKPMPLPLSGYSEYACSVCDGTIRQLSNFCPCCGARVERDS